MNSHHDVLPGKEPRMSTVAINQCWTEGRSSTAVAEDLGPTATATVAEVLGHSYGRRFLLVVFLGSSKMEAEMCFSLHRCHLRL